MLYLYEQVQKLLLSILNSDVVQSCDDEIRGEQLWYFEAVTTHIMIVRTSMITEF